MESAVNVVSAVEKKVSSCCKGGCVMSFRYCSFFTFPIPIMLKRYNTNLEKIKNNLNNCNGNFRIGFNSKLLLKINIINNRY